MMRGAERSGRQSEQIVDDPDDEDEREYWGAFNEIDENLMMAEGLDDRQKADLERSARIRRIENRRAAIISIVSITEYTSNNL